MSNRVRTLATIAANSCIPLRNAKCWLLYWWSLLSAFCAVYYAHSDFCEEMVELFFFPSINISKWPGRCGDKSVRPNHGENNGNDWNKNWLGVPCIRSFCVCPKHVLLDKLHGAIWALPIPIDTGRGRVRGRYWFYSRAGRGITERCIIEQRQPFLWTSKKDLVYDSSTRVQDFSFGRLFVFVMSFVQMQLAAVHVCRTIYLGLCLVPPAALAVEQTVNSVVVYVINHRPNARNACWLTAPTETCTKQNVGKEQPKTC